jgi:hypothetical protein
MLQKVLKKHQSRKIQMLKCPQSLLQKLPLSNPKPHHALWSLCAAMTALVKSVPKLHPQVAAAMASRAASLVTSQALVVMANLAAMVVARALRRAARVWAMPLSVRNVMLWNQPKTLCVVWLRKPTVKC